MANQSTLVAQACLDMINMVYTNSEDADKTALTFHQYFVKQNVKKRAKKKRCRIKHSELLRHLLYSGISMTRTSLGP